MSGHMYLEKRNLNVDAIPRSCQTDKVLGFAFIVGVVNCGRYVNGHAKAHFEENVDHMICMDCDNYAAYCYVCDDFVINDTKELNILREQLQPIKETEVSKEKFPVKRSNKTEEEENKRYKRHKKGVNKRFIVKLVCLD
ncbi:ubiquitin carboxyl-terminal hydrolase [Caerostris extrusa]|uniref:Ubiquitin carboxyl-terminal hydrolase n=1 Tax=Caerostris extrusa TaxID=172846 RepID=A0AAV4W3P5_CAEEX|nr:ubiquitin carboxyl-terminal hydrolase [Caerostris extrusa]